MPRKRLDEEPEELPEDEVEDRSASDTDGSNADEASDEEEEDDAEPSTPPPPIELPNRITRGRRLKQVRACPLLRNGLGTC